MELATIFINSFLPTLGAPEEIGRISGNGWAIGYVGGLIALALALLFCLLRLPALLCCSFATFESKTKDWNNAV